MVCPVESTARYRNRCLPLMLMYVSSSANFDSSFAAAYGSACPSPDQTPEPNAKCSWPKSLAHARPPSRPCASTRLDIAGTTARTRMMSPPFEWIRGCDGQHLHYQPVP